MAKSDYDQKRQERIARYRERAEKAKGRSKRAYDSHREIMDIIPLGQPILVGHHSETRHRRDLARSDNYMRKSFDESQKAEYWKEKALAAEMNTSISSDDPEALEQLREKLADLEAKRNEKKRIRAAFRKWKKSPDAGIDPSLKNFFEKFKDQKIWAGIDWEPVPAYSLQNLAGNIRRVRERIAELERLAKMDYKPIHISQVEIVPNKDENRVQIFFPGKPEETVRTDLKSNGFHWSPRNGCWQRQLSPWAVRIAVEIVGKHYQEKPEHSGGEK